MTELAKSYNQNPLREINPRAFVINYVIYVPMWFKYLYKKRESAEQTLFQCLLMSVFYSESLGPAPVPKD